MLQFLHTYRSIFLIFPVLFVAGNLFEPLSYLLLLVMMLYWVGNGQDNVMIIAMLFILILGDSRSPSLDFMKNLRILAILMLAMRSMYDMVTGKYRFNRLLLYSLPFFIVAIAGGLLNPRIGTSMAKMLSYFFLLMLALNYFPYHFRRNRGRMIMDIVYVSVVVFFMGLVFIAINPGFVYFGERYRGLLGNPNGLGLYAAMMFPMMMIAWKRFPHKRNTLRLAMGLLIFSVLLCKSRTALGTIGIFYFLYYFHTHGKALKVGLWLFVLPSLALFFLLVDIPALLFSLGVGEYLRAESITTGTGRFLAWGLGWAEILQNPWIGRGFAYEEYFFFQLREMLVTTEHQGGIHNSYLTFLMNNGFIGLLLFLSFLFMLFRKISIPGFGVPFVVAMLISANFESWLNSSLNAFTIHFLMTLTVLIMYPKLTKAPPAK